MATRNQTTDARDKRSLRDTVVATTLASTLRLENLENVDALLYGERRLAEEEDERRDIRRSKRERASSGRHLIQRARYWERSSLERRGDGRRGGTDEGETKAPRLCSTLSRQQKDAKETRRAGNGGIFGEGVGGRGGAGRLGYGTE